MQTQHDRPSMRDLIATTGIRVDVVRFPARAHIFTQGDEDDSVLHVESGQVELSVAEAAGREAICGLVGAGAFFGEEALLGVRRRAYTATTLTETDVLVIDRTTMMHLLSSQPEFAGRFIEHSVSRSARLAANLSDQLLYSTEKRLARILLSLSTSDDAAPAGRLVPDVTQAFIARIVGTSRSRVNLFLRKFKRLGFVEDADGRLRVHPTKMHLLMSGSTERRPEPQPPVAAVVARVGFDQEANHPQQRDRP